jgi:putative acetyltransferase
MNHSGVIRPETPDDHAAIRAVNCRGFGGEDEADLVDRLRAEGLAIASLVAVESERILGHILFSELPIETGSGTIRAAALAPMAVLPERQNQGIGSALVREGLEACRRGGIEAAIVLGHPAYYPRFGFSAKTAEALRAPFSGPAFMALELAPGALAPGGTVKYPSPFALD